MESMFWFLNDLSISAFPQLWSGVHLLVVCGDSLVRVVRQLSFQMMFVASCSLTQDFSTASTPTEYSCTIWCRKYQCCGNGVLRKLTFFGQSQIWDTSVTCISNSMQQSRQTEAMANIQKEKKMKLRNILVW